MSVRWFAAAVTATGLLLLPGTAGAQQGAGVVVEAARQVTVDPDPVRLYVTPNIAVHPSQPSTLAMVAGDARSGGCALRVSRDGGLSWATAADNVLPDGYDYCVQRTFGPVYGIAFASDGTLYVALSGSQVASGHPNGPVTALLARSTNLTDFETFVVAEAETVEHEGDEGYEQHRQVNLAVDPTDPDTVYVGWRQWIGGFDTFDIPGDNHSLVAVSTDGGETFGEPFNMTTAAGEALDEELNGSDTPMLAVAPDGSAYAFTKERPARPEEGEPDPLSRLLMARTSDAGETWETSVAYDGEVNIDNPAAAAGPEGNLYLTYASRLDDRENIQQVYALASSDGGATWSDPVNIGDEGEPSGYSKYFPGISVAPSGRVDVAWYDFRNDPFFVPGEVGGMGSAEGERYWDVYATSSTDGGRSWSPNVRVTDRSIDGDVGITFANNDVRGPIGVASTDSAVYVAWADTRAGSTAFDASDAYFTRVRLEPAPGATATPAGDDSPLLWSLVGAAAALAVGGLVLVVGTRTARRPQPAAPRARVPLGDD